MLPAFSSQKQAAAFAVFLLTILLLPVLVGRSCLPPRDQIYSSVSWGRGAYPYLHEQIFQEQGNIDIAFMGSSSMWCAIDTPYVQEKLGAKLGRPAVVRTLCWSDNGYEALYFIAHDLLERRQVRMIVFGDLTGGTGATAHPMAAGWFRFAESAQELTSLSVRSQASFYSSAILGMPRNLLGMLRRNRPVIPSEEINPPGFPHVQNPSSRLGSLRLAMGFGADHAFVDFQPAAAAAPADVSVFSESTRARFHFAGAAISPLQITFARKLTALAAQHRTKLVFLHLPESTEIHAPLIEERQFWPEVFGPDLALVGIPPATLFNRLTDENILRLYYNPIHLNKNGQQYFTPIVTPSLIQIYEDQSNP